MVKYTKILFIIVFIIAIGGVLIYLVLNSLWGTDKISNDPDRIISKEEKDLKLENKGIDSELNLPSGTDTSAGTAGSASGGGGGGSTGGSASGEVCMDIQIPYGLKDFLQKETCNEYSGGICIDKSINCSLIVHNIHTSVSGIFKIRFTLFKKGTSETLDYSTIDIHLGPDNFERMDFIFNLKNSEGKNATEEIECKFFTETVPKERVCS